MKNIILALLLFIPFLIFSQERLTVKSGGRVFNSEGKKLSPEEVRNLLQSTTNNTKALTLYNAGRNKKTIGNIFLYGGLTLFVGKLINDVYFPPKDANGLYTGEHSGGALYIIGPAMIIASIPIKIGYKSKIEDAVLWANEEFQRPPTAIKIESASFIANSKGVGVSLTF